MATDKMATATSPGSGQANDGKTWPAPRGRLANTFSKLLYRWTHSSAYRHNERLWRDVAITRDASGCLTGISIRGRKLRVENSRNLAVKGPASCHLIATGPSVNQIDYKALSLDCVIGVNGAIALQDKHDIAFDFYCIVDSGFVRNRPDLVAQIIAQDLTLFTTPLVLWHIAQCLPLEQIRCRVFLVEDMQQPVLGRSLSMREMARIEERGDAVLFDEQTPLGFSLNMRRGLIDGQTVAYAALQILVSLGFNTVYLHGLDMRNATHTPRFYEAANHMQPSSLDEQFQAVIEPSFRGASALLGKLGVTVKNLSLDSALDDAIFQRIDWRTLVRSQPAMTDLETAALV